MEEPGDLGHRVLLCIGGGGDATGAAWPRWSGPPRRTALRENRDRFSLWPRREDGKLKVIHYEDVDAVLDDLLDEND